jgi:hypothetical protein
VYLQQEIQRPISSLTAGNSGTYKYNSSKKFKDRQMNLQQELQGPTGAFTAGNSGTDKHINR